MPPRVVVGLVTLALALLRVPSAAPQTPAADTGTRLVADTIAVIAASAAAMKAARR